ARSAHPPRPHPRNERRQLSPQTEQATPAPDVTPASGQLATVLTAGKVRCSPCSRYCAWLRSSHPLRCAPWLGGCRSGRESRFIDRTGKLSLDVTELTGAPPSISACDVFFLRPPMQFLSGVDRVPRITSQPRQFAVSSAFRVGGLVSCHSRPARAAVACQAVATQALHNRRCRRRALLPDQLRRN